MWEIASKIGAPHSLSVLFKTPENIFQSSYGVPSNQKIILPRYARLTIK